LKKEIDKENRKGFWSYFYVQPCQNFLIEFALKIPFYFFYKHFLTNSSIKNILKFFNLFLIIQFYSVCNEIPILFVPS